jgi:hypothetical protein
MLTEAKHLITSAKPECRGQSNVHTSLIWKLIDNYRDKKNALVNVQDSK